MSDQLLWQHLEILPAQSSPLCDWNYALRKWPGFAVFKNRYLRLSGGKVMAAECQIPCGQGCARKVVEHEPDNIVAVCPEQEEKSYKLNSQEILEYSLNRNIFHKDLCSALVIAHRESKAADCRHTWRIGEYVPEAGSVFQVFITFQQEPDDLEDVVRNLCISNNEPFTVIAPTRRFLTPQAEQLLEKRNGLFLALSEEMTFNDKGILKAKRPVEEIFKRYQTKKSKQEQQRFQIPEGTKWSDIHIKFMGNPTVYVKKNDIYVSTAIRITVNDTEKVVSCEEAGMARKNNKMPTNQWVLLHGFAEHKGKLDWNSSFASKKGKKQKQELSNSLRTYFGA